MHQNGRRNFSKREAVILINSKKQELNSQKRALKKSKADRMRRSNRSYTGLPTLVSVARSSASRSATCSTPNKSRVPDFSFSAANNNSLIVH